MFEDVDGTRVERERDGVDWMSDGSGASRLTGSSCLVCVISPRTVFLCGKGRNVPGKFSNFLSLINL